MSIYEQNLAVLQETRADLYEKWIDAQENIEGETIPYSSLYMGDALDGEKFLAVVDANNIVPLASTYCPAHAAERYAAQYEKNWEEETLLLFGIGNIEIVKQILKEDSPIDKCIVYEPSISIFKKILEEYELDEILRKPQLIIMVAGINGDDLENVLYGMLNYENWRYLYLTSMPNYDRLFAEQWNAIEEIAKGVALNKKAELRSLSIFAKSGMENEIKAFYWMLDGKAIDSMVNVFPKEMPCIVVAAGPSLEKNVEVLRQAKGKAFIICVDTAVTFLLERGIVPDMTCTVDPQKGLSYFTRPESSKIPIAVSTDSDYRILEAMQEDVKPFYFSTTNDYCQRLYQEKGWTVEYFDGGGSVGTVCFSIGIRLGFKTIILIGQDLAFTDKKSHAGTGAFGEQDMIYGMLMVDGYYGDKVLTRMDFKHYIDWYNMMIPQLDGIEVINATEGGARLNGAKQMPLQEAVDVYCKGEWDVETLIENVPEVWKTREEKQEYYEEIKSKYQFYLGFKRRLTDAIEAAKRGIVLLQRGTYQGKELQKIDKQLKQITKEIEGKEELMILVKRTVEQFVTINDDLLEEEEKLEAEGIRLYKKMQDYMQNLMDALNELLPLWKGVVEKINEKHRFE